MGAGRTVQTTPGPSTQPTAVCPACGGAQTAFVFAKDGYRLGRCTCGLVRVTNPPDDEQLAHFYSFANNYGTSSLERVERTAARHLALLPSSRGRLLDVGAGVGRFVAAAREAGWDAYGIDLNADAVALGRDTQGLPLQHGTIDQVRSPDGSLDVVTFWDSLEHMPDPREALTLARGALRNGGLVAVSTPNIDGLYPRVSYPVGRRTGYWTHPEPPAHLFQFSLDSLTRLLEAAGFAVTRVVHERSPLKYTLAPGGLRLLARHPWRAVYAAAFLPALLAGPHVRAGDEIVVLATAV